MDRSIFDREDLTWIELAVYERITLHVKMQSWNIVERYLPILNKIERELAPGAKVSKMSDFVKEVY